MNVFVASSIHFFSMTKPWVRATRRSTRVKQATSVLKFRRTSGYWTYRAWR